MRRAVIAWALLVPGLAVAGSLGGSSLIGLGSGSLSGGTVSSPAPAIVLVSGPYTFAASDCGNVVKDASSVAHSDTVPTGLPLGCRIGVIQEGVSAASNVGNVTIAGAATVQVKATGGAATTAAQYAGLHITVDTPTSAYVFSGE